MEDESNTLILVLACSIFSWIFLHRWNQRNKKGPKTWPLVGAAIEQLINYDQMHDWLVNYLAELRTVVVPMPFTEYTYIADPENNIDEKSLRDIVLNFVIAGRDTTAATLSWAIYMIMMHDDVAEKLYKELKAFEEDRAQEENVSLRYSQTEDPESFNPTQWAEWSTTGVLMQLHLSLNDGLKMVSFKMHLHSSSFLDNNHALE